MQRELRLSLMDAISPEDIVEIGKRQVKKAKEGDAKSLEFVMKYILGVGQPVSLTQINVVDPESAARATKTIAAR